MAKPKLDIKPRKNEKAEMIVDTWGRIQVIRFTSQRGQRLVISTNLEDDTLLKAHDPADSKGDSKKPLP